MTKAKSTSGEPMTTADLTKAVLSDVSFDLGWSLIDRFSILERVAGSPHEQAGAHFIASRLELCDIPHQVYRPELYLSIPKGASVTVGDSTFTAKPPSFATSTGKEGLTAVPIHLPVTPLEEGKDLFKALHKKPPAKVAGKIVVTEGYPMPATVARLEAAGAVGQVYINPGSRIHWGICTTVWGTPGDEQRDFLPKTPIAAINRPDGDQVVGAIGDGLEELTLNTYMEADWYRCLIPVAQIDGARQEFLLLHGHYDSWDVGIGDNAVGDATLLELARIFHSHRKGLRRSLRVAWWPAHSTGRYAGSTWYADNFALELKKNCISTINIDSPGCRGATVYEDIACMAEAEDLAQEAVKAVAGEKPTTRRPERAGDYSFNQLGLTSFFMLLSSIPEEERKRLGYYPVGGCGGDIVWHTEKDRLPIADRDNLERDLKVYLTAATRILADEILPLDFRKTATELRQAIDEYVSAVERRLDLIPLRKEFDLFQRRLDLFYERIEEKKIEPEVANRTLLHMQRHLVHLTYAGGDHFEHDSATPQVVLPKLGRIFELSEMADADPERVPFVVTDLRRQLNRVMNEVTEASAVLEDSLEKSE